MQLIKIRGGIPLKGEIPISGAKNAALPLMTAALLTDDALILTNMPNLADITSLQALLDQHGVHLIHDLPLKTLTLTAQNIHNTTAPYDIVRKMRASILVLGPLLARCGHAKVSLPGGCAIGVRPIDIHLKAFAALGATIQLKDGYVEARADELIGTNFTFEITTVTGTVNAMMAASMAKGETVLHNCALEPEVVFCAEILRSMGVPVDRIGTSVIRIQGQKEVGGYTAELIPDRIETGTYMVAAAITRGELVLKNANVEHLTAVVSALSEIGVEIEAQKNEIRVKGKPEYKATHIETAPHPEFPTDMQAQIMSLLCLAKGKSEITETIFENRYMHVPELIRMGANIKVKGSIAKIQGVEKLHGAPVMATDLRASASLVLAGLAAEGTTDVLRIYHLDRGYETMEKKLASVGAKIERVEETSSKAHP